MSKKHKTFDEAALFKRKETFCGYRFCPLCGRELVVAEIEGRRRVRCQDQNCGFIFYQNPVPAAGALVVRNNQVLLVRRAHPPKIDWWCIPAGFMEWQEHPEETAVREVEEETGLQIRLTSFFDIYSGNDDPRTNAVLILYLADIVGGRIRPADDASEVRFFSFDDLPDKIAFQSHHQALADYIRRFRS